MAEPSQARRQTPVQSAPVSGCSTPSRPEHMPPRQVPARQVSGQVHMQRVRRGRSVGSVGNKTPRSVSAGSDRSLDPSSMKSWGEPEVSYYTDYTNPNQKMTEGLVSNFGIDSPSFSRRGSIPRASRKQVFPGVPQRETHVPGPDSYHISKENVDKVKNSSPKPIMGRASRNTVEYLVSSSAAPGVGKYDVAQPAARGSSFPQAPRLNYNGVQQRDWLTPRRGPGPADYHPCRAYDSTFRA